MALAGIVILAVLWWCRSVSLTAVSLDTFIGVMVGMVGILVTFAVGWQIINALEIKSKLAEIERLKTEINEQHSQIEQIVARSAYDAAVNRSYTLHKIGEYIKAFASTLEAIQHCLQIDEYEDLDILLHNLQMNAIGSHNLFCHESDNELIVTADAAVRQSPKYAMIKDRYGVTGIKDYDDFVLIGFSGLSVGDEVTIPEPGGAITDAVKRFWKHGLFSDVKILATKIEGDQVWLEIQLKQRPRISEVNYHGIKKGEREDLEARLGLRKGYQVTPNLIDRATMLIKKFFDGKGFKNVDVEILQKDDLAHEGEVIVDININKNEKTKIHKIYFEGNNALTDRDLKKAMKKTNEKFNLSNDWKSSILEAF